MIGAVLMAMIGLLNILGENSCESFDGTPCAVKAARTVWAGGKVGDSVCLSKTKIY